MCAKLVRNHETKRAKRIESLVYKRAKREESIVLKRGRRVENLVSKYAFRFCLVGVLVGVGSQVGLVKITGTLHSG